MAKMVYVGPYKRKGKVVNKKGYKRPKRKKGKIRKKRTLVKYSARRKRDSMGFFR